MASTYQLISSNVLSGTAASVTFSSIPSTYTDLVVRVSTRTDASPFASDRYYFNSGTANGSQTFMYGSGSAAASSADGAVTYNYTFISVPGSTYTSNTFGSEEIYIPNYAGSTKKPSSAFGTTENNATASYISANANLFDLTSAITSITMYPSSGNYVSGSSFYLYGIKNS